MRQAGFIAAAHLYALDNHVERLKEDHNNARLLATGLSRIPNICIHLEDFPTNIVIFDVAETGLSAAEVVAAARAAGVGIGAFGPSTVRAVTCLNISSSQIETVVNALSTVLTSKLLA